MPGASDFFVELDAAWAPLGAAPLSLHLIGSTALMLQTSYQRGTPEWRGIELSLRHLRLQALEVVDVVVSKLCG